MLNVSKTLLIGTAIETLIVVAGVFAWFCMDLTDYGRFIMLYASIPVILSWMLLCFLTILVFRQNR